MPLTVTKDNTAKLQAAVAKLVDRQVLVGIPDSTANRQPAPGEPKPASNAVIGYAMEFGLPDKNVPARPFLLPGIASVRSEITDQLVKGAKRALEGDTNAAQTFGAIGLLASDAVRRTIDAGGYAPLAQRTIEARARRRSPGGKLSQAHPAKEARKYLKLQAEGVPVDVLNDAGFATPLLDTRQLFRAITYVVRSK